MLVYEAKLKGTPEQYAAIDEAILAVQFVRNKCLRYWIDAAGTASASRADLSRYTMDLKKNYPWVAAMNSEARQASAERAWNAISRFYKACKSGTKDEQRKAYPRFKKDCRSMEYKQRSGWSLSKGGQYLALKDGFSIGTLRLISGRDLSTVERSEVKRLRLVRKPDGYYAQFVLNRDRSVEPRESGTQGRAVGVDLGLESFLTTSEGGTVENPRHLRRSEKSLKRAQRRVSRRKKGSANREKANRALARKHLKVSRQRKDHAAKTARDLAASNELVAYEDLRVSNMVRNGSLAKSISDASWSAFTGWLEYYGKIFSTAVVAVDPAYSSQECSECGRRVPKALSQRRHVCATNDGGCGLVLGRDENAARNILARGIERLGEVDSSPETSTRGHRVTQGSVRNAVNTPNARGEDISPEETEDREYAPVTPLSGSLGEAGRIPRL